MNQVSAIGQASTVASSYIAELCLDQKSKTKDGFWVEVPSKFGVDQFPEICRIDMWGEDTCSTLDDFPRGKGKTVSCRTAYTRESELFTTVRKDVESENWTRKEMKKVIQWFFNCTGKLPVQTCDQN